MNIKQTIYKSVCFLFAGFFFAPVYAQLFETWNAGAVDCGKWYKTDYPVMADFQSWVDTGELHHEVRPYSTASNFSVCETWTRMTEAQSTGVTGLSASVRIEQTGTGSGISDSFADISGTFYNVNPGVHTDRTGDVFASVRFGDRGSGLEAWWLIAESTNADFTTETIQEGSLIAPGTLLVSTDYGISIEYDSDHTFTFEFDGTQDIVAGPAFTGGSAGDPFQAQKNIRTRVFIEDGYTGNPDSKQTHAVFDDIMRNGVLFEDFSSGLNNALWNQRNVESAQHVVSGQLRTHAKLQYSTTTVPAGAEDRSTTTLYVPDSHSKTNLMRADVMLSSSESVVDANSRIRARIDMTFGNTLYSSNYNGAEGNFFSLFSLENRAGTPRILIYAETQDEFYGTMQEYFVTSINDVEGTAIMMDRFYTMSVHRQGTVLTYSVIDTVTKQTVTRTFDISKAGDINASATPVPVLHPPSPADDYKAFLTRAQQDSPTILGPIEVVAYWDNIYLEENTDGQCQFFVIKAQNNNTTTVCL